MKKVRNLNEWQDHLQMQADKANMTKEEWIAIHGSNIESVDEQRDGGLISDDEDEEMEGLFADVRFMTNELIDYIQRETDRIGGSFRAPGYEHDAKKLMKKIMKDKKFKF
jgi:hypothetical protein